MNFLQNLTIKRRLQLNAVVVGLAMVVLLCVIIYEARTTLSLNKTIQLAEELNIHELELRKHEKNFLFYKQKEALDLFEQDYNQLKSKIAKLNLIMQEQGIETQKISNLESLISAYNNDFMSVVVLQKRIGLHPTDGLYGELRSAVHEIESLIKEQGDYKLLSSILQLRRAEKDFMLRLDLKYLTRFDEGVNTLKQQISQAQFDSGYTAELNGFLNSYQTQFQALVEAQVELGLDLNSGALGEMRKSVEQSDAIVAQILLSTKQQVEQSVEQAQFLAILIFVTAGIIVLVLVYFTSRSIIVPIERVYHTINDIRRNNDLSVMIEQTGKDEITTMTVDFNSLIGDFKNLINEVNGALNTLNVATEHLSESTAATSSGMQEQLHEADMVATAATEMQATIQDISHNTEAAAKKSRINKPKCSTRA